MNNQATAGPSQQAPGAPRAFPGIIRPEQIQRLPHLDPTQKSKYEQVLKQLWGQLQSRPQDSPEYKSAHQKLAELSNRVRNEIKAWQMKKEQQQSAQQAGQQPGSRPQSQGQVQAQGQPQGQPGQQPQARPLSQQAPPGNGPMQQPLAASLLQNVQIPPELSIGTPEGDKFLNSLRNRYLNALNMQEQAATQVKNLKIAMDARKAQGQDIPPEIITKRSQAEHSYNQAKQYIDEFRRKQVVWKAARDQKADQLKQDGTTIGPQNPQSHPGQVSGQQNPQTLAAQVANANASAANASLDTARTQSNIGVRPSPSPTTSGPNQQQSVQAQATFPQQGQNPAGASTQQNTSQTPTANMPRQGMSGQFPQPQQSSDSPHSQSGNPTGQPVALSQSAALSAAARHYSDTRLTPQGGSSSFQQLGNHEPVNPAKMPIPTQLKVQPPQPISMGPARPTMGGPTNGAPGVMGQPALVKPPGFVLEGEGDRVLSKKKLDELVRQVTGGAEGASGESLTPEVEEVCSCHSCLIMLHFDSVQFSTSISEPHNHKSTSPSSHLNYTAPLPFKYHITTILFRSNLNIAYYITLVP